MSSAENRELMIAALRRLAGAEPDLGTARSANWHERVSALRALRAAVAQHTHAERGDGVPIERVIVDVKALVTTTLRAAHPDMEIQPIRNKVVTWCSMAYFLDGPENDDSGAGEPNDPEGLTQVS